MRVALNAQLLSKASSFRSGGISRYISNLVAEIARDPRGHSYDVFVPDPLESAKADCSQALRQHLTPASTHRPSLRIAWEQLALPGRLANIQPDLLHSLAYASPIRWKGPTVLTIYDLSFMRFPHAFNRPNRLYLSAITRASARRARRILTISEHSRTDITQLLGVPSDRIDVTYPGVDDRYRPLPPDQVAAYRAAHDLPDDFIFYVGTLEPRKNLQGLLDAYAQVAEPRPLLVVAGAAGWRYSPIFQRVQDLGLDRDVRFLGFVPEAELPLLYNAARLFAYPSRYEGFGLPVLEAMACGTPVLTSNVASLPEVAGRAAVLVSPDDPSGIAREMQRVLADPAVGKGMRAAGRIQASRFTWSAMADRTVRSYEQALGQK